MYLSRLKLDSSKRETLMAIASPNRFHGSIEQAFQGDRKRRLWRIDYLNGQYYILLLSEQCPDLTTLQKQFGYDDFPGESKDYSVLINSLEEGDVWHYRLVANPTRSVKKTNDRSRGKVCAQVSEKYMQQWIERKAQMNGFSLFSQESHLKKEKWFSFRKSRSGHYVRFKSAVYEGWLKIEDKELFKSALINGIGREKAYGMGLLTISK